MFPREEILRSVVFAAIGGLITLMVLKLVEKNEEAVRGQGEIGGENDLNEPPRKEPEENDERFC